MCSSDREAGDLSSGDNSYCVGGWRSECFGNDVDFRDCFTGGKEVKFLEEGDEENKDFLTGQVLSKTVPTAERKGIDPLVFDKCSILKVVYY